MSIACSFDLSVQLCKICVCKCVSFHISLWFQRPFNLIVDERRLCTITRNLMHQKCHLCFKTFIVQYSTARIFNLIEWVFIIFKINNVYFLDSYATYRFVIWINFHVKLNVYKNTRDVSRTRSKTNVSLNNMITSKSCQDAARYVKINW